MTNAAPRRRWYTRLFRWLVGAPVADLPAAFGSSVPPELQAFEAHGDAVQRSPRVTTVAGVPHQQTHVARQDESLERQ